MGIMDIKDRHLDWRYIMARKIAIGIQDFGNIREENDFYVDKTMFIKEWWGERDKVTLITRPRRFGKTLTMNMLDYFFSVEHRGCSHIFEGLKIWNDEKYRQLQGTYPVISLSFANIKANSYNSMYESICAELYKVMKKYDYLFKDDRISKADKVLYDKTVDVLINANPSAYVNNSLNTLSDILRTYYGKRVIILLDEYDTPMQDAYLYGYWDEAAQFFRGMFNSTFKTNPCLERAVITGITRISKESIFSDLNNLEVVSVLSNKYATSFGFTEDEVFAAMDEFGMDSKDEIKRWYDGFTFGSTPDIYNPWSVTNALDKKKCKPYWVNTSSNALMNSLIKGGDASLKMQFEELLKGNSIKSFIDEEIIYNQLDTNKEAVWSFMLAAGYLKVVNVELVGKFNKEFATMALPNLEVESMVNSLIGNWFKEKQVEESYNGFLTALLCDNVKKMNDYMNKVALKTFSYFDTGKKPSDEAEPERFYHGFVLGLVVELEDIYEIKSNRESGFGRYDVMLKPFDKTKKAFIFEFKVKDTDDDETTLEDTVKNALLQIDEKQYEQELISSGIPSENIRKYAFAFEGKRVLIG
jgi:hypothetical protein